MDRRGAIIAGAGLGLGGLLAARPDQQYYPAAGGAQIPGSRTGPLRAREVIVFGSGKNTGVFVYSPAPAFGNLIASIAALGNVDPYGNAYLPGIVNYFISGTSVAVQLSAGQLRFSSAATAAGPWSLGTDLDVQIGADGLAQILNISHQGLVANMITNIVGALNVNGALLSALNGAQVTNGLTADTGNITAGLTWAGGASGDFETLSRTSQSDGTLFQATQGQAGPSGASVRLRGQVAGDRIFAIDVVGEANRRFHINTDGSHDWGSGSAPPDTFLLRSAAHQLAVNNADLDINTIGRGLQIAEGTNARMGVTTLVAGSKTVANTTVTGNTRIFLSVQSAGGTQGFLSISSVTIGTNFTIHSTNAADTSVVAWLLVEPG